MKIHVFLCFLKYNYIFYGVNIAKIENRFFILLKDLNRYYIN
jgi:hypothetical protein